MSYFFGILFYIRDIILLGNHQKHENHGGGGGFYMACRGLLAYLLSPLDPARRVEAETLLQGLGFKI